MLAQRLDSDRLLAPLARNDEPRGEVEQQAGAAGEGERGERDAVDERVDVEVTAEPCADAAYPASLVGADEPPRGRLVESGGFVDRVGHVSLLDVAHTSTAPGGGAIGHDPDPTLIFPGAG